MRLLKLLKIFVENYFSKQSRLEREKNIDFYIRYRHLAKNRQRIYYGGVPNSTLIQFFPLYG